MEEPRTPESSQYDEWRLAFDLPESSHSPEAFVDRVRPQLNPEVAIHRNGRRGIRIYATSRERIDKAEMLVRASLDAWQLHATLELTRWNPGAERWQDPSLAIDPPQAPQPDPWAGLDEMAWEVRLRFESASETDRLVHDLRAQGVPVLAGWKRCLTAAPDEETARQRAEELRLAAPRARIEVRPISRFRRWMISQRVHGNYG